MAYYIRSGNRFNVTPTKAVDITSSLPPATYTVKVDQMTGQYFLEIIEGFSVPSKLYGDVQKRADRILSTSADRPSSTGILLEGEQGSGKTMLAKVLSVKGLADNIPTIVINEPHCGEGFNSFIQSIDQQAIIIFDEFEKVYDSEDQKKLLTLLDGVYPSQKLFVLTANDAWGINGHLNNRPGRIFYRIKYKGLAEDFIREYCADNLFEKDEVEGIVRSSRQFADFNFDMLKALVEEMNRYGETAEESLILLNAKPEFARGSRWTFSLTYKGESLTKGSGVSKNFNGNPFVDLLTDSVAVPKGDDPNDREWRTYEFLPDDIDIDNSNGSVVYFKEKDGFEATLTRKIETRNSYDYDY